MCLEPIKSLFQSQFLLLLQTKDLLPAPDVIFFNLLTLKVKLCSISLSLLSSMYFFYGFF